MAHTVAWFDIPVSDMTRAIAFYEALTGQTLARLPVGEREETALFEAGEGDVSGCLFASPDDEPSLHGSRIYLSAGADLDEWIARVEDAGGAVLRPKTEIPGRGHFAYIRDSEGNRVGLHGSP